MDYTNISQAASFSPSNYFWEGVKAFKNGVQFDQNPHPKNTREHDDWAEGFETEKFYESSLNWDDYSL